MRKALAGILLGVSLLVSAVPISAVTKEVTVYITATGKCYHTINNCGNTDPTRTTALTVSEAEALGYKKCGRKGGCRD